VGADTFVVNTYYGVEPIFWFQFVPVTVPLPDLHERVLKTLKVLKDM